MQKVATAPVAAWNVPAEYATPVAGALVTTSRNRALVAWLLPVWVNRIARSPPVYWNVFWKSQKKSAKGFGCGAGSVGVFVKVLATIVMGPSRTMSGVPVKLVANVVVQVAMGIAFPTVTS